MEFDPEITPLMEKLTKALRDEIPGFSEILESASADDVMSTMTKLNDFLLAHPEHAERITELTQAVFTEPALPAVVKTDHYAVKLDADHIIIQTYWHKLIFGRPLDCTGGDLVRGSGNSEAIQGRTTFYGGSLNPLTHLSYAFTESDKKWSVPEFAERRPQRVLERDNLR